MNEINGQVQSVSKWARLPSKNIVETVITALEANGINVIFVETKEEAKEKTLSFIPLGAEVMTMTSKTLDTLGLPKEINESGKYNSIRKKFASMDRGKQKREMKILGSAPEYAIGSVHAVTQDGKVIIASNTGSQLPAYIYGSDYVIWIVGTQKIVTNMDEAMKRLYDYVLPLESKRIQETYGLPGSFISKLVVLNREITPGRIKLIFVNEVLGF